MSVLSDEQYMQMARDAGLDLEPTRNMLVEVRGQHAQLINFARAVADAAIAADRAARAEQSARLQAMGMSAGAASDYVEFVSHRQHCAIRHGLDACTCDYAKAAAPAPSQGNGGAE